MRNYNNIELKGFKIKFRVSINALTNSSLLK